MVSSISPALLQAAQINQNTVMRNWMRLVNEIPTDVNQEITVINNEITNINTEITNIQSEITNINAKVFDCNNISFTAVANASNILAVTLTAWDGSALTADNKGNIPFKDAVNSNIVNNADITTALSISTIVGASFGTVASLPFKIWILALYNGGSPVLGLFQSLIGGTTPTNISPLIIDGLVSSTAMSAGATSGGVIYTPSGVTVTNSPYRIIGYIEYSSGLATPGTYTSNPTSRVLYGPGVKLPGDYLRPVISRYNTYNTTSAIIPYDDTIPQITEGTEFITTTMTPSLASSLIMAEFIGGQVGDNNVAIIMASMFRDAVANALGTTCAIIDTAEGVNFFALDILTNALAAVSTTFRIRIGNNNGTLVYINGRLGARKLGGNTGLQLKLTEYIT